MLKSIEEQGKLSDALKQKLLAASTKTQLEDLYLPYKPKRRTKAQIAREAGLEPLAMQLLEDPAMDPETLAAGFVDADKGVNDVRAALDGAKQILMEYFSEDAELLEELRETLWREARIRARVVEGKEQEGAKFSDYFDYSEALGKVPSHRALALFRGRNDGVLIVELDPGGDEGHKRYESRVARRFGIADRGRPADGWLLGCVDWAWKVKLFSHLDLELKMRLRSAAEETAIGVFGHNLHDLLLAAPAGEQAILGLDPGLRTGVKVAVVNRTGSVVDTATIYPHAPRKQWEQSLRTLAALAAKHGVSLVAIGNGTGGRETERFVLNVPLTIDDLETIPFTLLVPDLKVSFMAHKRCVVHIARRSAEAMQEFLGHALGHRARGDSGAWRNRRAGGGDHRERSCADGLGRAGGAVAGPA